MKGSWAVERLLGLGPGAACVALGGETGPEAAKRRVQLTEAPQSPTGPAPWTPLHPLPSSVSSRRSPKRRISSRPNRSS